MQNPGFDPLDAMHRASAYNQIAYGVGNFGRNFKYIKKKATFL